MCVGTTKNEGRATETYTNIVDRWINKNLKPLKNKNMGENPLF